MRPLLVVLLSGALAGASVGIAMPRGPVTAGEALALMVLGLALGTGAGWVLQSRWAMVAAPATYVAAFELLTLPSTGLTVDRIELGSTWGLLALLVGRGFHGLVVIAPMLVGAALGAGAARRSASPGRRGRTPLGTAGLAIRRVVTGIALAGLAFLALSLAHPARTPTLSGRGAVDPGAVTELTKVRINGVEQWLSIRGASADLPVLLYLPGGPGQSDLGLSRALLAGLTNDVLVVTWDGRGIGKSYPSFDPNATSPAQIVADTVAVADYLRARFVERRILLFGESGGSVTGVLAVQQHPDRFSAWLGSGQMVAPRETDRRINRALMADFVRRGDVDEAAKLRSFGQPPYDSVLAYAWVMDHYDRLAGDYDPPASYTRRGEESGVGFLGLAASEYTLIDKVNALRGLIDTFGAAYPQWQSIDFRRSVRRLAVPVYIFTGSHELAARRDLADAWFDALEAPHKHRYSYADAGHATAFEHADDLRRILRTTVRRESHDR